jgi:hypothetical protein
VYAYSPADLAMFLADGRFEMSPTATVVFVNVERFLYHPQPASLPAEQTATGQLPRWLAAAYSRSVPESWSVAIDQWHKKPWLTRYALRVVRDAAFAPLTAAASTHPALRRIQDSVFPFAANEQGMMFTEEALVLAQAYRVGDQDAILRGSIEALRGYRSAVEERGLRFVFMPIPDKERIYWDAVPGHEVDAPQPTDFLARLTDASAEAGIEVVRLEDAFHKARADGLPPYHPDDTHWSPAGVSLAAQRLAQTLKQDPVTARARRGPATPSS